MESFCESMKEYQRQLKNGSIQKAYKGLMEYMMGLKGHFAAICPDYHVSGNIYAGYMDMTYFAIAPKLFRQRGLKVAVVFLHEPFRFEVWLAATNKTIQAKYWKLIKASGWDACKTVPAVKDRDAILECIVAKNPNFGDLNVLSEQIEAATLDFISKVENFLLQTAEC